MLKGAAAYANFCKAKGNPSGVSGKLLSNSLETKTTILRNRTHLVNPEITMNEKNTVADVTETGNPSINNAAKGASRRKFLGQVGAALTGGMVLGKASLASAQSEASDAADGVQLPDTVVDPRVKKSFAIRVKTATKEARIHVPPHTTNGDEQRYPDKSGTYTKGILQDGIGLVNLNAYQTFKRALNSGRDADFENIIIGGTRTLNGPQGGLAFRSGGQRCRAVRQRSVSG